MPFDSETDQDLEGFDVPAHGKILKRSDTEMTFRDARVIAPGRTFSLKTLLAGRGDRRDRVVGMLSMFIKLLTIYSRRTGPRGSSSIATARKGVRPALSNGYPWRTSLQSIISPSRIAPSIAQLRNKPTKLVAGVGHGQRFRAVRNMIASQYLRSHLPLSASGLSA